jgi:hypothetical protein
LAQNPNETTLDVQKQLLNELAKEDVNKKMQEGKIERAKTKEEREQE